MFKIELCFSSIFTGFIICNANKCKGLGKINPIAYESDLRIAQLDRNGTKIKEYVFNGAHPTDLSPIDVAYSTTDEIERFTVTFQYQYWTTVDGTAA